MFLIQSETIFELEYVFLVYATEKYFHVFLLLCVTFSTWAFSSLLFPFFFIVGLISFLFLSFNFAYEHALLANYYLFFFPSKITHRNWLLFWQYLHTSCRNNSRSRNLDIFTAVFISALFGIVEHQKQPRYPPVGNSLNKAL